MTSGYESPDDGLVHAVFPKYPTWRMCGGRVIAFSKYRRIEVVTCLACITACATESR